MWNPQPYLYDGGGLRLLENHRTERSRFSCKNSGVSHIGGCL